jgi:hypothetical protein
MFAELVLRTLEQQRTTSIHPSCALSVDILLANGAMKDGLEVSSSLLFHYALLLLRLFILFFKACSFIKKKKKHHILFCSSFCVSIGHSESGRFYKFDQT